jgi:hypothetical protein
LHHSIAIIFVKLRKIHLSKDIVRKSKKGNPVSRAFFPLFAYNKFTTEGMGYLTTISAFAVAGTASRLLALGVSGKPLSDGNS